MELTQEQKIKENEITTHKMFDLAEKCIMEYMLQHMLTAPETLFINPIALGNKTVPLILKPITTYSNKLISLTIDVVPWDYVCNIPQELQSNETINNMIGFIYHSVTTVYNTILNTNISDNMVDLVIKTSIHLEMDDSTLSMFPIFIFPTRRKQLMFLQIKDDIEETLKKLPEANAGNSAITNSEEYIDKVKEVKEQYAALLDHIKTITYDVDTANIIEKNTNVSFKHNKRIGIIFKEVEIDQLPDYYNSL